MTDLSRIRSAMQHVASCHADLGELLTGKPDDQADSAIDAAQGLLSKAHRELSNNGAQGEMLGLK